MLSPAQIEQRDGKLTASRVACFMTGDEAEILNLWREMVGDPSFASEDLSDVWPVQLGSFTEPLNLDWFEKKHGPVSRRGEVITHANGWAACTLDGWSDLHNCPIETKHCGGREAIEVLTARYMPQMTWQMIVTGSLQCAFSPILGADEPRVDYIEFNKDYADELMRRAEAFMQCVWNLRPPVALSPVAAPVKAEVVYDMTGKNEWAAHAATWSANIAGKKQADKAEKDLKALVPADAARCHGHGIEIKRDRAGRLSLREKM